MSDRRLVEYPSGAARRYRDAGAWTGQPIAVHWQAIADARPDADAVVAVDGRLSYRELAEGGDRLAAGLLTLGLVPGDRVLLQVTNRLGSLLVWYGLLKAGLIPVCTLANHRGHEITAIARKSGAVAHVVDAGTTNFDLVAFAQQMAVQVPELGTLLTVGGQPTGAGTRVEDLAASGDAAACREQVERVQHKIGGEDLAVLQLSGGTTGVPKLIPRRHDEYWYNGACYARALGWDEHARVAHVFPIVHNAGIACAVHSAHSVGATTLLAPSDPDVFLPLLARERVTDLILVGTVFGAGATNIQEQLAGSLRRVILSGSKPPAGMFDVFEDAGVWTGQLFGMAEGMLLVTPLDAPRAVRACSVGIPISELDEVLLLEPNSELPVSDGEIGELCARGPYTIRGYYDDDSAASRFTSTGFYRTGDLARRRVLDGHPCYSIEGRIKDVIDRGGEKISAEEVEALLAGHPKVRTAAVVAIPDARLGERACAFIVPEHGQLPTLTEIRDYLRSVAVAKYKWPEHIEPIDELPRTSVGKIDKAALRRVTNRLAPEATS